MINFNLSLTFESLKTILRMIMDIFIMWMLLYYAIKIVKNNSKTIQIFKGIALILIVNGLAKFLGLDTVVWLSDMFLNWGFLAIIIVFQPEVRSILEKLGKSNVFSRMSTLSGNEKEKLVDELVTATMLLSRDQTGALISLEQSHSLSDFIKTGTQINSVVTAELITSIFVTSTPLHDGAVIIQGDRIACASAYFPPTNLDLPSRYGARHRAAIGISEITDAITIVVSEETGAVSITEGGKIITVNRKQLRDYLIRVICGEATEVKNVAPTHQLIIEKEIVPEVITPSKPAQEYIVEEKKKTPENEDKKDTKFDTAILSKLAVKRQAEEEEANEEKEMAEEVREPIQPVKKEKKKFSFFKSKRKEVKEKVIEVDHEEEMNRALDEEEASIKLPRKKDRPTPSYPIHELEESEITPEQYLVEVPEEVEEIEEMPLFDDVQVVMDEPVKKEVVRQEFVDNTTVAHSEKIQPSRNEAVSMADIKTIQRQAVEIPTQVHQATAVKNQIKPTQPITQTSNVRVMGVENTTQNKTDGISGEAYRKARLEAIKQGKTMYKEQQNTMQHPVFDEKREDIVKKPERAAFKADFSDKSETANLSLTGGINKPVKHDTSFDTSQFARIDADFQNIEDLIQADDNLEDQFAMLDTMSIKKPAVTEILDIKPANRAGGDQR